MSTEPSVLYVEIVCLRHTRVATRALIVRARVAMDRHTTRIKSYDTPALAALIYIAN